MGGRQEWMGSASNTSPATPTNASHNSTPTCATRPIVPNRCDGSTFPSAEAVNQEVADGSVLRLIRQILTAGVLEPGASETEPTQLGTPQGGPLSPLLANIYLHRLDLRMVAGGYGLVRYADDFVIFAKSES